MVDKNLERKVESAIKEDLLRQPIVFMQKINRKMAVIMGVTFINVACTLINIFI